MTPEFRRTGSGLCGKNSPSRESPSPDLCWELINPWLHAPDRNVTTPGTREGQMGRRSIFWPGVTVRSGALTFNLWADFLQWTRCPTVCWLLDCSLRSEAVILFGRSPSDTGI